MDIKSATHHLLQLYNIQPDKRKSQNFLISEKVYDKIVNLADVGPQDTVLEIGPGLGFLTTRLLERAGHVVTVEVDEQVMPLLTKIAQTYPNLTVVQKNILGFDEGSLPPGYKVVANIPYHLTGKILRKFLSSQHQPTVLVLLVQREVAERVCASAGQHSLLSLAVQTYAQVEVRGQVGSGKFFPQPKVTSAILYIHHIHRPFGQDDEILYWRVARIGFSGKRKTLVHNLSAGLRLPKERLRDLFVRLAFSETVRAQELAVVDWLRLLREMKKENLL